MHASIECQEKQRRLVTLYMFKIIQVFNSNSAPDGKKIDPDKPLKFPDHNKIP